MIHPPRLAHGTYQFRVYSLHYKTLFNILTPRFKFWHVFSSRFLQLLEKLVVANKLKALYTTLGLRPNKAPVGTPISFRKLASGGTTPGFRIPPLAIARKLRCFALDRLPLK